ncbi:MAG: hypothetical protein ACP5IN_07980 [Caldimicrobium sp.]
MQKKRKDKKKEASFIFQRKPPPWFAMYSISLFKDFSKSFQENLKELTHRGAETKITMYCNMILVSYYETSIFSSDVFDVVRGVFSKSNKVILVSQYETSKVLSEVSDDRYIAVWS